MKTNLSTNHYDNYNFQKELILNLADSLFKLEESISQAYQEKPKDFIVALSELQLFVDKIIGMNLKYNEDMLKLIKLYLTMAKLNYDKNALLSGAEYLSKAYQKICNIIKSNDMMFPRLRKVTSFKEWTNQQL